MTLNAVGFDGTVNEAQWSRLLRYQGEIASKHGVATGFNVTPGTGTRAISISTGTALLPGVLIDSDATATLNFDANTGTATRTDYVVLRADWSANSVVLAVVKGTSTTAPALTQTEGSVWELPLARVGVRPPATSILTSDITPCKPLPRTQSVLYRPAITDASIGPTHAATIIATAQVVDPGWPYRLRFNGSVSFAAAASGYGRLIVQAGPTIVGRGQSFALNNSGGNATAQVHDTTDVLTGPTAMTLQVVAQGMGAGDGPLATGSQAGLQFFTVEVVPA